MNSKIIRIATIVFGFFIAADFSLRAQGTAFTYQGQLQSGSGAANGTYDLTFKLFNASSGGSQVGSTITVSSKVITNGLFTTGLDFGSGVFTGTAYWLELGVRTNGAGSFTTLSPRQQLTPTPYAITAENVNGVVAASQLTGTVPAANLSGANGGGLTTLNASQLTSGTVPDARLSANVALLANANTFVGNQTIDGFLKISDGAGTGYYSDEIIGPGGYVSGEEHSINFNDGSGPIGSLIVGWDGAQGYFKVGNLYRNGTHFTNTTAFTVFGNGNVNVDPAGLNAGFLNNGTTNSSGLTFGATSGEGIASQRAAGINQFGLDFYTGFIKRMSILNSGYVGIGTTNPTAQLHVVRGASTGPSDTFGGGPAIIADTTTGDGIYVNSTAGASYAVWANGNSIGVLGNSSTGTGVDGTSTSGTGLEGFSTSGTGVYAYSSSGSALTIANGAIHVSGASTNATPTTAAFTQVATAANIGGDTTTIHNVLCDGDPNAILIVTPNWNPRNGPANFLNKTVGVWYDGTHWGIFTEDGSAMPVGPAFNVLIIKN